MEGWSIRVKVWKMRDGVSLWPPYGDGKRATRCSVGRVSEWYRGVAVNGCVVTNDVEWSCVVFVRDGGGDGDDEW